MSPDAGALLEALVQAESPSGRETPAAEVLLEHLPRWGLETEQDAVGNVLARTPDPDPGAPTVCCLGHIDTVPGQLPVAWEDGTLTGRGAVDAKGPLVAHALAAARLAGQPGIELILAGAVGEEADSRGARHLARTLPAPDALVIAEPTGLDTIGLGYKGRVQASLTAQVEPTHAGAPEPTAAERILDAIDALTTWTGNPDRDPGVDEATLRVIDLDVQHEARHEHAHARLDLRVPGDAPDAATLAQALPRGVELEIEESVPAVRADPRNPVATALRGALREREQGARAVVKTGTSDWNHVHAAWDAPTAVYGPGDPHLDHTPDERIALADVEAAGATLERAIERLAPELVHEDQAPVR